MKIPQGRASRAVVYSNVTILGICLVFVAFNLVDQWHQRQPSTHDRELPLAIKAHEIVNFEDNPTTLFSLLEKNAPQVTPQQIGSILSDCIYQKRDASFKALLEKYDSAITQEMKASLLLDSVRWRNHWCAAELLKHQTDPNQADAAGLYPLHWAYAQSDNKMIQLLLDHNANPNPPLVLLCLTDGFLHKL